MIQDNLPVLQVIVPLVAALLAALSRRPGPAWVITAAASWIAFAISLALLHHVLTAGAISYHIGGWDPSLGIEYRVDVFNALILVLVSGVAAAIAPFAWKSVAAEIEPGRVAWFYTLYLLSLAGLLGIAITGDAFNAFVFLEISSLSSYTLISLGRDRRALVAAYQYLILGTIGATFYIIGVGFLYLMTGTLNLGLMAQRIVEVESTRAVLTALAFITVGISLKLALFPLHVWLPNAYAYAPSTATVFLAATSTKVAIYLFVRYLFTVFGAHFVFVDHAVTPVLMALSIAAIFGAGTVAVFQSNVKRMFAYSSVAQIGYITLGIAIATQTGLTGGIVHIVNHGLIKAALFMALGAVMLRIKSCAIDDLAGIGRKMPQTLAALVIAGLGLIGVPGTVGFVSKWYLVVAAFEQGWWWLGFLIVASSLLTVVYVGRVVEVAWFREPSAVAATASEAPLAMLVPIWLLAGATVFFGLDAGVTTGIAGKAAAALLGGPS